MHVGGGCACFGADGSRREALARGKAPIMRYDTHNIDSLEHAAAIVSTWLLWFNSVAYLADIRQPFTLS